MPTQNDWIEGEERVTRCIDDSFLWDKDIATSFWHTFDYIKLCANNGIVFNRKKFQFSHDTLEFAGFEVTPNSYQPLQKVLSAIRGF